MASPTPKMNRVDFDYAPMELPNVLSAHMKRDPKLSSSTGRVLASVILPLARARPNWTFAADTDATCTHFDVFCGSDYLGSIYSRGFYDDKTIGLTNHRLQKLKTRRGDTRTTLPKKAIKLVLETFALLSNEEYLVKQAPLLKENFSGLAYRKGREFAVVYDKLDDPVKTYLFTDWTATSVELIKHGADPAHLTGLDEKMSEYKGLGVGLSQLGSVVATRGANYFLSNRATLTAGTNLTYTEHTSDSLPPHIREGVGLLKLNPDNTYVDNAGYRASYRLFFITRTPDQA